MTDETSTAFAGHAGADAPMGGQRGLQLAGDAWGPADDRYIAKPIDHAGRRARLEAAARRLDAPTLLVRGGTSDVLSEDGVRHVLALCPHAEFVNVAQAGHMVAGDRNDLFGRAAMRFLGRTVPAGRARP